MAILHPALFPPQLARPALAGERLVYDVELLHLRPEGASVLGRAFATDQDRDFPPSALLAEAEIFFAHLDQSRSKQLFGDRNFVFSGEMKYLLGRMTGKEETGGPVGTAGG